MRRWLVVFSAVALMLSLFAPAGGAASATGGDDVTVAESPYGSYIVMMELEPLVASYDQADLASPSAKAKERGLKRGHEKALKDAGVPTSAIVNDYTVAFNGFAVAMSHADALNVARQDGVLQVVPNELRQLQTDNSPTFLGLTGPAGAWSTGYTGEDVVVGVIDTGIWPEHPSFADDGSYSDLGIAFDESVRSACDFGDTAYNPDDAPFECNNKLLGARDMRDSYEFFIGSEVYATARDYDGHGTHTASTAAGNSGVPASILGNDFGEVSGIAPRARVVAYSACGELGCFTSDLVGAIDQAVADGVHVINYSIGGGASLAGSDDIAFLFAASANVWVATSNGNNGPGPYTVGGPASVPWVTSVGASTQNRTFQGSASSSDGWEFFGASITAGTDELPLVDAEDAGDELCAVGALDPSMVSGKIVLCKRGAYARVAKSQAVMEAGGAGMILYNGDDTDTENTDNHYVPSVHINNTDGLVIKAYIDSAGAAAVAQINGGTFTPIDAPWMAAFSSRGPNPVAEDLIKPDITAPGVNILAGNTPTPVLGAPGQLFQAIGGTSMSSPHVAGMFALLRQAHPDWTAAMAKSAIMTTAYQDVMKEDGATPADPFDMGAGHLNPGNAVAKGSAFQPGLVYDAGLFEYAAFTCGADLGVFTPGSCDFLDSLGVPFDASDLNLPSIGIAEVAGSQTITRTVTSVAGDNGWRTYTVSVDAPEGYAVDVSPSSIRLKSGMSASYEVTVTNLSAPAGEWRFGSLTWTESNKHYAVSSPIAVKAAMFSAPAAVEGAGVDGSASFDVTFGYTGSYAAAAHGLVPATETNDSVGQDPDQTFDPADVGNGATAHAFALSGSAFFRLQLTYPDPNIDLDVFVLDSGGNQVASSTNGGTDELIELLLPADDIYTVYVHGWQTTGLTINYTLESWDVSATPGGSLTIDSAPASATLGATETVSVSWSGLAASGHYLGAVSHTGDAGLMGLTLVEVDTN